MTTCRYIRPLANFSERGNLGPVPDACSSVHYYLRSLVPVVACVPAVLASGRVHTNVASFCSVFATSLTPIGKMHLTAGPE